MGDAWVTRIDLLRRPSEVWICGLWAVGCGLQSKDSPRECLRLFAARAVHVHWPQLSLATAMYCVIPVYSCGHWYACS